MERSWTFAIDRGGTFTDVVARSSDGRLRVEKLLSENPGQYEDAALEAIRRVLGEEGGRSPRCGWARRSRPTRLLERKGERVALAITRGFGDALADRLPGAAGDFRAAHRAADDAVRARGRDRRAGRRRWRGARAARRGAGARRACRRFATSGIDALAIVLMHGWRHSRARGAARRDRARARLHPGFGQPRGRAADQADRARRHDRGRRLSVAGAAPLRRSRRRRACRRAPTSISCSRTAASPKRARFAARTRSCPARPAEWSEWSRRARRTAPSG